MRETFTPVVISKKAAIAVDLQSLAGGGRCGDMRVGEKKACLEKYLTSRLPWQEGVKNESPPIQPYNFAQFGSGSNMAFLLYSRSAGAPITRINVLTKEQALTTPAEDANSCAGDKMKACFGGSKNRYGECGWQAVGKVWYTEFTGTARVRACVLKDWYVPPLLDSLDVKDFLAKGFLHTHQTRGTDDDAKAAKHEKERGKRYV